jgi:hypothetical protein
MGAGAAVTPPGQYQAVRANRESSPSSSITGTAMLVGVTLIFEGYRRRLLSHVPIPNHRVDNWTS